MATFKKTLYLMLLLNSFFVTAQFQGDYAIANWSLSNINGNGSIDTTNEPNSITLTGTDGLSGAGNTNYTNIIANTTQITFSWAYSTSDGASFDYPNIIINNGTPTLFSGYGKSGSSNQSGSMSISVNANDTFAFNLHSVDNAVGAASVTISNFTIATTSVSSLTIFGEMTTNVSLKVNKNGQVGGGIGILSSGKISN
jgi:hypothetical protein